MKHIFHRPRFRKKKQDEIFNKNIEKSDHLGFLKEVDKAINDMLKEAPDLSILRERMNRETSKWLKDITKIDAPSFKLGVCFGLLSYCSQKQNDKSKSRTYYVS